jgi:hypothetical protein
LPAARPLRGPLRGVRHGRLVRRRSAVNADAFLSSLPQTDAQPPHFPHSRPASPLPCCRGRAQAYVPLPRVDREASRRGRQPRSGRACRSVRGHCPDAERGCKRGRRRTRRRGEGRNRGQPSRRGGACIGERECQCGGPAERHQADARRARRSGRLKQTGCAPPHAHRFARCRWRHALAGGRAAAARHRARAGVAAAGASRLPARGDYMLEALGLHAVPLGMQPVHKKGAASTRQAFAGGCSCGREDNRSVRAAVLGYPITRPKRTKIKAYPTPLLPQSKKSRIQTGPCALHRCHQL